jgi:NACHT domain
MKKKSELQPKVIDPSSSTGHTENNDHDSNKQQPNESGIPSANIHHTLPLDLFNQLNNLVSATTKQTNGDSWASGFGINEVLQALLGDIVHVIDPVSSSVSSPASADPKNAIEGAINYAKMINGFVVNDEEIANGFIQKDGGSLKKPIIMVINTSPVQVETEQDTQAEGGLHWQCCVVLPKNYKTPFGPKLQNAQEIIYYLDSLDNKIQMPLTFENTLRHGFEYTFESDTGEYHHLVRPVFPEATIIDSKSLNHSKLQQGGQDCGWWAFYNAIMLVCTGSSAYLKQFTAPSRIPAFKLRTLFPALDVQQAIPASSLAKGKKAMAATDVENEMGEEEYQALQLAIANSLKDLNLKEKSGIASTQNFADMDSRLKSNYKDLTADGLRKSLHGNLYQLGLLTLVAVRAEKQQKPFYLVSEAKEFEKFDDLVIDYGDSVTFLQAKHSSQGEEDSYKAADFCSNSDGDASLAKYFDSWTRLKKGKYTNKEDGASKTAKYIFFTNRRVDSADNFLDDLSLNDDEFWFEDLPTKTYSFKPGKTRSQFIDAIRASSEEVKNSKAAGNINLDEFIEEFKVAAQYLQTKVKEKKKSVNVDGRSKLSTKTMALIALAQSNKEIMQRIVANMKDTKPPSVSKTLSDLEIKVSLENPLKVLGKVMAKEIEEFLDEFVIKVEQPNLVSLDQLLIKELHINANIAPLELFHALHNFMLAWFSKRHECLLKSDALHDFIAVKAGDLNRFYLLGSTQTFEQESESYPIDTKGLDVAGLQEFLEDSTPKCPVAFVSNGGGVKQRVYQTIKRYRSKEDVKDAEWAYLTSDSRYLQELPKVLKGHSTQFVVLDCRTQSEFSDIWLEIFKVAVESGKKLVLLIEDDQKKGLIGLLRQCFETIIASSSIPVFKVPPLTDGQLRQICKGHTTSVLNLGGKHYKLAQVLEDNQSGTYQLMQDLDTLCFMMGSLTLDSQILSSGLPYDVYEANDLVEGIPQYNLRTFLESVQVSLFVIEGIGRKQLNEGLRSWFNKEEEIRYTSNSSVTSDDIQYRLIEDISDFTDSKEKLIHILNPVCEIPKSLKYIHIKLIDVETFQIIVVENSANAGLPIPEKYDFATAPKVDFSQDSANRNGRGDFSIVAAHAGYGKSAFCLDQRFKWSKSADNSQFWVIRLNLPHLQFSSDNPQLEDAFTRSSTGEDWPSWKLKALEIDMTRKGQVRLLLDGLDEIKDELMVRRLNNWLTKIPPLTDVLITTRPYAANKVSLPKTRLLDRYLTLKPYNDLQQKQYIKKYLKALFNEFAKDLSNPKAKPSKDQLEVIVEGVYKTLNTIVAKNVVRLLGVPLESYIFCESIKPRMKEWWLKQKDTLDVKTLFDELANLNTVMLYQRFILAKFQLFFQKHMEMPLATTLRNPHRIYSFAASYTDILMVFAFRQAFGFPYDFVNNELRRVHYTKEMLEELSDTGLAIVVDSLDEKFVRFNHETYQEYFAALFLLRGIIHSKNNSFDEVRRLISEHCFNLKYRMIFVMAAQLSLSGDPIIPGWDQGNNEQVKLFWCLLNEPIDLLGAAKSRLLRECVQGLLPHQRADLRNIVKDEVWATQLIDSIDKASLVKDLEDEKANEVAETELPVLVKGHANKEVAVSSKVDKVKIKGQFSEKSQVLESTITWLKKIKSEELAVLFGEIVTEDKLNSYWDIDGGFQAIAQLGDAFNIQLAQYFVKRIDNDPSWRANSALNAMSVLFKPDLCEEAKNSCLEVIICLVNHVKHITSKQQLLKTLRTSPNVILQKLVAQLNATLENSMSDVSSSVIDCEAIFLKPITLIRNIFWIALETEYAVIIDYENNMISFVADNRMNFTVVNNPFSNIFKKILKEGCAALKAETEKDKWLSSNRPWNALISEEIQEEFEQAFYMFVTRNNKVFKKFFEGVKEEGSHLKTFFSILHKYHFINEYIVDLLTTELSAKKATDRGGYTGPWWSLHGGIASVGMVGRNFNRTHADYFILRAGYWPDNRRTVIEALKQVKSDLEAEQNHDEHYAVAVQSYTFTLESLGLDLEAMSLNESSAQRSDEHLGVSEQVFDYFSKHIELQRLVLACQTSVLEVSFTLIGVKKDEVIKFCTTNLGVKTEQVEEKTVSAVVITLKSTEQVKRFQALINQKTEKDKQVA